MTVEEAIEILETIDNSGHVVSEWEANFIDTCLCEDPLRLTPKRREVIDELVEKYL